jgi:hypothetical protein
MRMVESAPHDASACLIIAVMFAAQIQYKTVTSAAPIIVTDEFTDRSPRTVIETGPQDTIWSDNEVIEMDGVVRNFKPSPDRIVKTNLAPFKVDDSYG